MKIAISNCTYCFYSSPKHAFYGLLRKLPSLTLVDISGNNELDQIQKIHKILGTPPQQLLEKMKRQVAATYVFDGEIRHCQIKTFQVITKLKWALLAGGHNMRILSSLSRMGQASLGWSHMPQLHAWISSPSCWHTILTTGSFPLKFL